MAVLPSSVTDPFVLGFAIEEEDEFPRRLAPAPTPRATPEPLDDPLDDWEWDETFSTEPFDVQEFVASRVDLVKILGGRPHVTQKLGLEAEKGELTLLKCLVKQSPELADGLADELGRNFLHVAATYGRGLAVAWCVRKGMRVNLRTHYGMTPLMLACAWGRSTTAALLLDLEADPTLRDRHGRTALSMASDGLREELVHHPGIKKHGRAVMGDDIDAAWIDHSSATVHDDVGLHEDEQFRLRSAGVGVSERYNVRLYSSVQGILERNESGRRSGGETVGGGSAGSEVDTAETDSQGAAGVCRE